MWVKSVECSQFRNYDSLQVTLDPGINIFHGKNAQGKTNLLEAVYLCGTAKSHRVSRDRELIRFGSDEAHIRAFVMRDDVPYRIDLHLRKNKSKGIAINGLPIKKASELFGLVHVVLFAPEDLQIIKSAPSERRNFLDVELCQLSSLYVHDLVKYSRVIRQRNDLLKQMSYQKMEPEMLSVWTEQAAAYGRPIIAARREFITQLNEKIEPIHKKLTGGEVLRLIYEPDSTEENLEKDLLLAEERDIRLKTTTVGPHRDDISFMIEDLDIRKYGSQGQQRTAALALKLAEIELVKERTGQTPILLLDDVLSELDSSRQNHLLDSINGVQTLITCTGLDDFVRHRFHIDSVFEVDHGSIVPGKHMEDTEVKT